MKLGDMNIAFMVGEVLDVERPGGFPILQLHIVSPPLVPWLHPAIDVDVELDLIIMFQVYLAFLMAYHRNVVARRPHMDLAGAIVYPIGRSHAVLAGLGQRFAFIVVTGLSVVVEEYNGGFGEPLLDGRIPAVGRGVIVDGMNSNGAG